jgi:ankyrin repeat protein
MEEDHLELLECARYGELEDLQALLSVPEININFVNSYKNTAAHMAAANNHVDILRALLARGALVRSLAHFHTNRSPRIVTLQMNEKNESGDTPLHWAALNGQLEGLGCAPAL